MIRRDRVKLLATLNEAMDALLPMVGHAESMAAGVWPGGSDREWRMATDARAAADAITERRHAHTGTDGAAALMAEAAAALRSVASSLEACAFGADTTAGDWRAAADSFRCEWCRLHGQRTLMEVMFPVN